MAPVFVDTGAWIAMAVVRDQFHKEAASCYRKLSGEKLLLVTSNYVLIETYTRIRYDDGHAKSVKFHSLIQDAVKARKLKLEWVTPNIHQEAWDIFEDYADQVFSFAESCFRLFAV